MTAIDEIVRVPFHGEDILTVDEDGKPHIILKPAIEALGVDYWTQVEKLRRRSWACTGQRLVQLPGDNQRRPAVTVDVRTFLMLLATIDERRVAAVRRRDRQIPHDPESRPRGPAPTTNADPPHREETSVPLSMFPDRLRRRHRAPITDARRDQLRRILASLLLGAAVAVIALALLGVVDGLALIPAVLALAAVPLARWGTGLGETVAPKPDVHTPPVATATGLIRMVEVVAAPRPHVVDSGHLMAIAEQVGVYRPRHASVPPSDTPTTRIPQVQA